MARERMSTQRKIGIGLALVGGLVAAYGAWGAGVEHYSSLLNEGYADPYGRVYSTVDQVSYTKDELRDHIASIRVVTHAGLMAFVVGCGLAVTGGGARRGSFRAALQAA